MFELKKIEKFQLFCLEAYKLEKKNSGVTALNEFEKYNVFDFLSSGYEVLHTQSLDYTVKEIITYLESQK